MNNRDEALRSLVVNAWGRFERMLADQLPMMNAGDEIVLAPWLGAEGRVLAPWLDESQTPKSRPHVRLTGAGRGWVRADALGYPGLDVGCRQLSSQERLTALGWASSEDAWSSEVDSATGHFWTDTQRAGAVGQAVATVTRTLREILGVEHPAFLDVHSDDQGVVEEELYHPHPIPIRGDAKPIVPRDLDHLWSLVQAGLPARFRVVDRHRAAMRSGDHTLTATVTSAPLAVEFTSVVATGIGPTDQARVQVDQLNREYPGRQFFLVDDQLVLRERVPARPFVACQVHAVLWQLLADLEGLTRTLGPRLA